MRGSSIVAAGLALAVMGGAAGRAAEEEAGQTPPIPGDWRAMPGGQGLTALVERSSLERRGNLVVGWQALVGGPRKDKTVFPVFRLVIDCKAHTLSFIRHEVVKIPDGTVTLDTAPKMTRAKITSGPGLVIMRGACESASMDGWAAYKDPRDFALTTLPKE